MGQIKTLEVATLNKSELSPAALQEQVLAIPGVYRWERFPSRPWPHFADYSPLSKADGFTLQASSGNFTETQFLRTTEDEIRYQRLGVYQATWQYKQGMYQLVDVDFLISDYERQLLRNWLVIDKQSIPGICVLKSSWFNYYSGVCILRFNTNHLPLTIAQPHQIITDNQHYTVQIHGTPCSLFKPMQARYPVAAD